MPTLPRRLENRLPGPVEIGWHIESNGSIWFLVGCFVRLRVKVLCGRTSDMGMYNQMEELDTVQHTAVK